VPNLVLLALASIVLLLAWRTFFARSGPLLDPAAPLRPVVSRGDLAADEATTIELFRQASPSVVNVHAIGRERSLLRLRTYEVEVGTGSGFFWSEDGYVVTNAHVLRGADSWRVTLSDQRSFSARLVGIDRESDVGVLKIEGRPPPETRPILLGDSRNLRVGQKVFAIGNPFGLDQTLTTGVISGLDRAIQLENSLVITGLIQTDAAINPGNSGGPLLDSAGLLIGMNTAIVSPTGAYSGIGFAIPSETVNQVATDLIRQGSRRRSYLGVVLAPQHQVVAALNSRMIPSPGALIVELQADAPAELSGLARGDLLVELDGVAIASDQDLQRALMRKSPGDRVRIRYYRDGVLRETEVTLGARPR
jgi:S1-C subfamily serine protease